MTPITTTVQSTKGSVQSSPPEVLLSQTVGVSSVRDKLFDPAMLTPDLELSDMVSQISQLQMSATAKSQSEEYTPPTESVAKFFKALGVKNTQFTQADLQELYRMMGAHPMSHAVSFYALFGLEFSALLDELDSNKPDALKKFLPEKAPGEVLARSQVRSEMCRQTWCDKYLECYSHLLKRQKGAVPIFAQAPEPKETKEDTMELFFASLPIKKPKEPKETRINSIEHFYTSMKELFEKELANKKRKNSRHSELYQRNYDKCVVPFLTRWNTTRQLFEKFLLSDQSLDLLVDKRLASCLGIGKRMPLSTVAHARVAGKNLHEYIRFTKQCVDYFLPKVPKEIKSTFADLLSHIDLKAFEESSSPQNMTAYCAKLHPIVLGHIRHLEKLNLLMQLRTSTLPDDALGPLVCSLGWMQDFLNILQGTILPIANPLGQIQKLHLTRAMMNIGMQGNRCSEYVYLNKSTPNLRDLIPRHDRWQDPTCPTVLRSIHEKFLDRFTNFWLHPIKQLCQETKKSADEDESSKDENLLLLSIRLSQSVSTGLDPRYAMKKELKALSNRLKALTDATLSDLSEFFKEHPNERPQLPFLDMTEDLARMFILRYDLDMTLYGQSEWSDELPLAYLQLLDLEEATDSEDAETVPVVLHEPSHERENLEGFSPLELQHEDSPHAFELPSLDSQTSPPGAYLKKKKKKNKTSSHNLGLKKGMKMRHAVRVLQKIQLASIEKGDVKLNGTGHSIPNHGTLGAARLHLIQGQAAKNIRSPTSST
jgi:hypothetical protein